MLVAYGGGGREYGMVHWVSVGCWRANGGSFTSVRQVRRRRLFLPRLTLATTRHAAWKVRRDHMRTPRISENQRRTIGSCIWLSLWRSPNRKPSRANMAMAMAQFPPIWLNGYPIDMPVAIMWRFGAPIDVLSPCCCCSTPRAIARPPPPLPSVPSSRSTPLRLLPRPPPP